MKSVKGSQTVQGYDKGTKDLNKMDEKDEKF